MSRPCGTLALILAASAAALAQGTAVLKGTTREFLSGEAFPGVSVTARNVATGVERQIVSGPDGAYAFANLAAGTYSLTASAAGLLTMAIAGVEIKRGAAREFDLTLRIAPVTESVEVAPGIAFRCPTQSNPGFQPSETAQWDLPVRSRFSTTPVLVRDASGDWQLQFPAREKRDQDADRAPSKRPN